MEELKLFPIKLLILVFLLYLLFSNKSMKEYIRSCIKVGVYIFSLYLLYYNKIELCMLILLLLLFFNILTYTPDDAEDEIEISIKDNRPIATVKLVDNKRGIVQVVYENENNKVIVCETSPYNFLANEEKQIEIHCYNLNEEKLSELKLIKYNFIEE